jgi:hypothetical protein
MLLGHVKNAQTWVLTQNWLSFCFVSMVDGPWCHAFVYTFRTLIVPKNRLKLPISCLISGKSSQKDAESGSELNFHANQRTTTPTKITCRIYMVHTTRMHLHIGRKSPSRKDLQRRQRINVAILFQLGWSPSYKSSSNLGFHELQFGHHFHLFHLFHSISTNPCHRPISMAVWDFGSPESREEARHEAEDWHKAASRVWLSLFVVFSVV